MSTNDPTEKRKPDRTAVALDLTRFMRAAWIDGFSSGMATAGERDATIEAMMSRLETDPALISRVTRHVDDLVLSLLSQDGAVSTVAGSILAAVEHVAGGAE